MIKAPHNFCVLFLISIVCLNSFAQEIGNNDEAADIAGRPLFTSVQSIEKYAQQGIDLFESYLKSRKETYSKNNLQSSMCSPQEKQSCKQSAIQILTQCKDDDSEECWKKITLVYPKCLKCFCPYILAKTCQVTNFIEWLAYVEASSDGCSNLLQKECLPLLFASALNYYGCDWCMCMAKRHGYETYFDCGKQIMQKGELTPKHFIAKIKRQ